jgi:single-stranded-DNA-specific exonuclease
MESAGLSDSKVSAYDVGFRLAPRINAAGRMGHARLAVELLTEAGASRAREIALYLEEQNRSRQSTERQILKQACELIEKNKFASDAHRAIVVAAEGWHAGVIGIVASRIVERYHRPAVMIALTNGDGQGSARSIGSFNLAAALARCAEHLVQHGGHAMAAGLKLASAKVGEFREAFVDVANNSLTGDDLVPKLRLDAEAALSELTLPAAEMVAALGPFGTGNPRPLLATDWVELAAEPRAVGSKENHLQASFRQNGLLMRGVGFGLANHLEDLKQHRRCRVAFEPVVNEFNGRRSVEMHIVDMKFPAV